jgi:AcrR family transcriptional regulator
LADTSTAKSAARKQRRDPERTREAILEVAGRVLSKDGPEGLSVSRVAQLAGVNRGTAYHHFQTREELLNETTAWVSEKLCREVFGDLPQGETQHDRLDPRAVTNNLVNFAMENPEFGRIWLFKLLSSSRPASDPFWKLYKTHIDDFVASDLAQPDIDSEVHAVLMLVGVFLWPVWARSHAHSVSGRRKLAERFSTEVLRLNLHGSMRTEKFPGLELPDKKPGKARKS